MTNCHLDFETRSEADIKKVGAYLYANHPSTEILCLAFAAHNDPPMLLTPPFSGAFKSGGGFLKIHSDDPGTIMIAHNAFFEQCIWDAIMVKRYGFKPIPIERWRCTMVKALAHSLPASLDQVAHALNLSNRKDSEGHKIMMKLSKPRRQTKKNSDHWWTPESVPEDFKKLYAYCMQDVETERELDGVLRDLSKPEQRLWHIDQRINQQGIYLDIPVICRAVEFGERRLENLLEEFRKTTGGEVDSPRQRDALLEWSAANGYRLLNTQEATVRATLARKDVPPGVRRALEILQQSSKTSLAKFPAMLQRSKNGILREFVQYHGAHTGRWAGRGVQLQNLPRAGKSVDETLADLLSYDFDMFSFFYGDIASTLSRGIRGAIIAPPGHRLFIADFKQIEARVLAWLAGQQDKLDLFIAGADLYCDAASKIYGYLVTKDMDERQVGKVADLALGYGGGINAFAKMAKGTYNVDLHPVFPALWASATADERVRAESSYLYYLERHQGDEAPVDNEEGFVADIIKQRWRKANPAVVDYWYVVEQAAIEAVRTKKPVDCGMVRWFVHDRFLFCKLPSNRVMAYPYPEVNGNKLTYYGQIPNTQKWGRIGTYGGKLTENIVQAISRDIMAGAMVRMEDVCPVRMHTHDEVVSFAEIGGVLELSQFKELMEIRPSWAQDCPIESDAWSSHRYGKA